MRINRTVLLRGLAAAVVHERERRVAAVQAADDAAREQLLQTLDSMAERMRAAPGWREPTEEEQRANIKWLNEWMVQHGYAIGLDEE